MKPLSNTAKIVSAAVLVFIAFISASAWFVFIIRSSIENEARTSLESFTKTGVRYIAHHTKDLLSAVKLSANFVSRYDDLWSDEVLSVLKKDAGDGASFAVIDMNGKAKTTDGRFVRLADREYFQKAKAGESSISQVEISRHDGARAVVFAAPIVRSGEVRGVLTKTYSEQRMRHIFDAPVYGRQGFFFIVDKTGNVIQPPTERPSGTYNEHPNVFDITEAEESDRSKSKEAIKNDMAQGRGGLYKFTFKGSRRLMYYAPVGINDWYMLAVVPYDALAFRFAGFTRAGLFVSGVVALALLILMTTIITILRSNIKEIERSKKALEAISENVPGGVSVCTVGDDPKFVSLSRGFLELLGCADDEEFAKKYDRKVLNTIHPDDRQMVLDEAARQQKEHDFFEIEHRIDRGRDVIWVRGTSRIVRVEGTDYIYSIVCDITRSRQTQEELALSEERHRIVMENTEEYIFDWDLVRDTLYCSPKYVETYGGTDHGENVRKNLGLGQKIHKEDWPQFDALVESLLTGAADNGKMEMRLKPLCGGYTWCGLHARVIRDKDGRPVRILGIVKNIDEDVKARQALMLRAETDDLTGLQDKGTTERLITDYLEGKNANPAALFVIDIDNFKGINDTYGHLFGDIMLSELGGILRKTFRGGDIVGRIGGDEFMALMKNVSDGEAVIKKAEELLSALPQNALEGGSLREWHVTCSIGAALYPRDAADFVSLYEKADSALYSAKLSGKNRCALYDEAAAKSAAKKQPKTAFDLPELAAKPKSFRDNLCEYILKMLYTSKSAAEAIQLCMGIAGRYFNASRCYIIEYDLENGRLNMPWEWTRADIAPVSGDYTDMAIPWYLMPEVRFAQSDLAYLPRPEAILDENGAAKLHGEGVKAMISCAFMERGEVTGFIGMDECVTDGRPAPTDEERETISMIGNIFGAFIAKERARERERESSEIFNSLLNNTRQWVYAIDADTFQLTYFCPSLLRFAKDLKQKDLCYKALLGRDAPCADCPAVYIKEHGLQSHEVEKIMEPDGFSGLISAVMMAERADGKRYCLLSLRDITKYK
ncbi:MAG: diguanylate cyclase [Cloacibacillus sp.]